MIQTGRSPARENSTGSAHEAPVSLGIYPKLLEALRGELTPKFLATRSEDGLPNVVPLTSLTPSPGEPGLLHFGNFLLRKSVVNLKQDPRLGVLVITPELEGWVLTGTFEGFEREGPHADAQRSAKMLRYNAYTGIRNAGLVRVRSVERSFRISRPRLVRDYALAGSAGLRRRAVGGIDVPLAVRREFARLAAVKVVSWIALDGWPRIAPALSLQPAGHDTMVCWPDSDLRSGPEDGALVAANVLTMEAVSYQIKGCWQRGRGVGTLVPHEVYAGGPPLPGGRIA
jgi:Pyridoxamine 5'-phosphate oxidase